MEKFIRPTFFTVINRINKEVHLKKLHAEEEGDERIFKITQKEQSNYRKLNRHCGGQGEFRQAMQFGVTCLILKNLKVTDDNYLIPLSKEEASLQKDKKSYRVVFTDLINSKEVINVARTERFDVLINKNKLNILECRELDGFVSSLSGSFYMDELRDEVIDLIDYHETQIKIVNGIGEEYD